MNVVGECQGIDCYILAAMPKPSRATAVVSLFACRSPSTVIRFVISVVVYAINGMFRGWARPHIGVEIGERKPTLTDDDTSGSVVFMPSASRNHLSPNFMLGRFRHAVDRVCHSCGSRLLAATTPRRAGSQSVTIDVNYLAASTRTSPPLAMFGALNDREKSERHTRNVDEFHSVHYAIPDEERQCHCVMDIERGRVEET